MEKIYKVLVDYGMTVFEMIAQCACEQNQYDWALPPNFSFDAEKKGKKEVDLVLVGETEVASWLVTQKRVAEAPGHVNLYQVLGYFATQNLLPAEIEHLLAFGAKYSDVQKTVEVHSFSTPLAFPLLGEDVHGYPFLDIAEMHIPTLGMSLCSPGEREFLIKENTGGSAWSAHYQSCFLAIKK